MDHDFENDVRSGHVYLSGFLQYDARGVPCKRYYKEGSKESVQCRQALARVLRSNNQLPRQLREMLADMFEFDTPEYSPWGERKLTASNRAKKRPRDHSANTHLTLFVWQRVSAGAGVDAAINEAIEKFNVSRELLYRLWRQYKPLYERISGPIPSRGGPKKRKAGKTVNQSP